MGKFVSLTTVTSSLILMLSTSCATADLPCDSPSDSITQSVVRVVGDDGSWASGVVVDNGRILTAAHVIRESNKISVGNKEELRPARLIRLDGKNDLAMLDAQTEVWLPIRVGDGILSSQQRVWAVGFPLAKEQVASAGRYEQLFNGGLQTTADVDSGQSGGGLITCQRGDHVLSGIIRGFGAYREGDKLYKLKDFSISVDTPTIKAFISTPQS